MVNQKYLDKAEVLIEALPYIQRFNRKIVVVKYGGSAMLDDELKKNVIKDVVLLKLVGFKPIIVHGGGKEISRWVGKVGMEPKFINGLRVTDKDTMEDVYKRQELQWSWHSAVIKHNRIKFIPLFKISYLSEEGTAPFCSHIKGFFNSCLLYTSRCV